MQRAEHDPALRARIVARRPMLYAEGPNLELDRPAHVRAASGVAWVERVERDGRDGRISTVGSELAVIQDDANFIALVDPHTGLARAIALPAGPDGHRLFDKTRGTKHLKLDLEACFTATLDGVHSLIAFGSGSTAAREQIVMVALEADSRVPIRVVHAQALYAALRARRELSGSELNLEGATLRDDDTLLLFQRGNGAPCDGRLPLDATCELGWPELRAYLLSEGRAAAPALGRVTAYTLGELGGVRLTFTDASRAALGSVLFLASAEASPDVVRDGDVVGNAVGVIDARGHARWTPLLDEHGQLSCDKVEGIALDPQEPRRAWVTVDADDPALAAQLLELELCLT